MSTDILTVEEQKLEMDIEVVERHSRKSAKRRSREKRLSLGRQPTTGQRNVGKRKIKRKVDKRRKSLVRLSKFALEPEENDDILPPVSTSKRKKTDCLFFLLIVVYFFGMLTILGVGYKNGNPARLIYGSDSEGRVCGDINEGFVNTGRFEDLRVNNNMQKQRFVVFPRTEKDLELQIAGLDLEFDLFDFDFFSVCASKCPREGDIVCTAEAEAIIDQHFEENPDETRSRDEIVGACLFNDDVRLFNDFDPNCVNNALAVQCFDTVFNTTSFLFRCFPEYVFEVDVIGEETGCLEFQNTVGIFGNIVEDCVKFKQVTKTTRVEPPDTNIVFDTYNTLSREFDQLLGDMINAGYVILGVGVGVAFVTSFLYIMALKKFVGVVIWGTILLGLLVLVALTLVLYIKAGVLTEEDLNALTRNVTNFATGALSFIDFDVGDGEDEEFENFTGDDVELEEVIDLPEFISESEDFAEEYRIMAYIATGITLIVTWLVLLSFSRINRAIGFFKEAGRCIKSKPQLLLLPFISGFFGIVVVTFYVATALYITSSGNLENSTLTTAFLETLNISNDEELFDTKVFGPLDTTAVLNLFLFFGFLWLMAFVSAINLMTISGVVSKWYWAGSPSTRKRNILEGDIKISVMDTFCTVLKFHLGTAAFGALLIAMVQFVRYMAAFVQARMNKMAKFNRCVKILHCALNCCLKCAEKCVKFISHNAYYMTMLYGTSFCTSTRMAFTAFASNLIQVATVTFLGDIILRFGQVFIVGTSMLVSYLLLDGSRTFQIGGERELSSIIFPVFLTMLLSWFMAKQVLSVYQVAIDTILLSYCQDKKLLKYRNKRRKPKANKNMEEFVEENKPEEEDFMVRPSLEVYT